MVRDAMSKDFAPPVPSRYQWCRVALAESDIGSLLNDEYSCIFYLLTTLHTNHERGNS